MTMNQYEEVYGKDFSTENDLDEFGRVIFKDHPPTKEELAGNSVGYCYMSHDIVSPGTIKELYDGHSQ
jgi:hypothetical protein